jgi:outer membrane protein OmpA-like peptidoglycan-associated protein
MLKLLLTIICWTVLLPTLTAQKPAKPANDTFSIYFDLNISALNKKAQNKIDSLIYLDKLIPGSNIMIIGYTDYLGSGVHNQELSEERAKSVEDYLLNYNFRKDNIKICIGKGEIERTQRPAGLKGYPTDRKVDIAIVKKEKPKIKKALPKPPVAVKKEVPYPAPAVATAAKGDISSMAAYKPGETIRLKNLYFLPQRHALQLESKPELDKLYAILKTNPTMKIQIEGHVCCIRDFDDALDIDNNDNHLSLNRAKQVYIYLVEKGIDPKRLKYAGFGRSRPIIADEETEEDANANRRVEIRILEK